MKSSELIVRLTADLAVAPPSKTGRELVLALAVGGAITTAGLLYAFGVQPGLLTLRHGLPFLMKLGFAAVAFTASLAALLPLARAAVPAPQVWLALAAPIACLLAIGALQIQISPSAAERSLVLGGSFVVCPLRIAALALPLLGALLLALRRQAPVRLAETGAAAGLVAGAGAAGLYAFACPENGAVFVALWYSAGLALTAALGALVGTRALRW